MVRGLVFLLILLLWVLLSGTAQADGPGEAAVSASADVSAPLTQTTLHLPVVRAARPARYVYYVPIHIAAARGTRLGLAGGTAAQAEALGGDWLYDWTPTPSGSDQIEAVPMISTARQVEAAVGGSSEWLLTFNEPDLCPWQACLSPAAAVEPYLRIEALHPDRRIVSPAPSSADIVRMWTDSAYRGWLPEFREAYRAATGRYPTWGALALHCYEWTAERCIAVGEQFIAWAAAWGVPEVWVTEVAYVSAWAADPAREARAFMVWAETRTEVTRVAPFTAFTPRGVWYWPDVRECADPSLFVGPGSLTMRPLAEWYRR